jgi:hypothetical protein
MKKGTTTKKKKRENAKERKEKNYEWREKREREREREREGEEKMDKCSTGQKNPPLRKRGIKKRRIMDMCTIVSRAHFSKK